MADGLRTLPHFITPPPPLLTELLSDFGLGKTDRDF